MSQTLDATLELVTEYHGTLSISIFNAGEDNEHYRIEGERGMAFGADSIKIESDLNTSVWFYLDGRTVSSETAVNPRRFEVKLGRAAGSFIAE
jgi:hypothetical protein